MLATGNHAVVLTPSPRPEALDRLPAELATRIAFDPAGAGQAADLAAVLADGPDVLVADTARHLAAREGAIVTLHTARDGTWPLDLLLDEVSLSVNTTAAGGNASLMALA